MVVTQPQRRAIRKQQVVKTNINFEAFIPLSEIFGGGGRYCPGVLKESDKSRYMLSLSFILNLTRSVRQDHVSRSLFESRFGPKG